jgi:hypothetical protein
MPSTGSQSLAWLLAIVYGAAAPMETLAAAEGNAGEGAGLPGPARDPTDSFVMETDMEAAAAYIETAARAVAATKSHVAVDPVVL